MLCLNSVFRKQGKGQEKDWKLICEKMAGTVRAPFGHKPKKRTCVFTQVLDIHGAPERIRTSDLCLRRAALYPAELRAVYSEQVSVSGCIVYGFLSGLYSRRGVCGGQISAAVLICA